MADVNANIGINIDATNALAQLKALQKQIGAFHRSVAAGSEAAALAQRDLQRTFLNSVNATGLFSAQLTRVKTSAEAFTDSLQNNKFSMREYFRYSLAATKTFGKNFANENDAIQRAATDNVKRLATQYVQLGREANGAMQAIAITPNKLNLKDATVQMQIAAQRQAILNQLLKQGSTNLINFGKNTQWAGRQLMVGFTIPLVYLGTAASKAFMDMETAALKFRKVYGDLGTTQEDTQKALEDIQNLAKGFTQYGIAASDTISLASEAAAAGYQGVDLQRQVTEATRLQVLGQIEQSKAFETTIALQKAFQLSSEELAGAINFLNAVENQTVLSLDDVTTAIPKIGPIIEQLGGDFKTLTFFLAAMKERGVQAGEGANALKTGLLRLISPTTRAKKTFQGLGIDLEKIVKQYQDTKTGKTDLPSLIRDLSKELSRFDPQKRTEAIKELFGIQQAGRLTGLFTGLLDEGGAASKVLGLISEDAQSLANLADKELGQTAASGMNKFRKAVEDLKIQLAPLGKTFLEVATPIIEWVGDAISWFNKLSPGVKKVIARVTAIVAGLGPVILMTFGLLANALGNSVKLFNLVRIGLLKLRGAPTVLGTEVSFLTKEQQDALAAADSLGFSHAKLAQYFGVEKEAVKALTAAYREMIVAQKKAVSVFPAMMSPVPAKTKVAKTKTVKPKKRSDGKKPKMVGGIGNQDTELALLTPGETVVPADMSKKYAPVINAMIDDKIPGYQFGLKTKKKKPQPRDAQGRFTKAKPKITPERASVGLFGASMLSGMLPETKGIGAGDIAQGGLTGAFLASLVAKTGVGIGIGAAIGAVVTGIGALISKQKEHENVVRSTYTASNEILKIFGTNVLDNTLKINVFNDKLKQTKDAFGVITPEVQKFVDAINALPEDSPVKTLVNNIAKPGMELKSVIGNIKTQVTDAIATGGLDPAQAENYVKAILAAANRTKDFAVVWDAVKKSTTDAQAATTANLNKLSEAVEKTSTKERSWFERSYTSGEIIGKGYGDLSEKQKILADQMQNLFAIAGSGQLKFEDLKARIDGVQKSSINGKIGVAALSAAIANSGNADAIARLGRIKDMFKFAGEEAKMSAADVLMFNAVLQTMGEKDLIEWGKKQGLVLLGGKIDMVKIIKAYYASKDFQDLLKIQNKANEILGGGVTTGDGETKKKTFFDKELAMLNKKRDALKEVNDELKRQNDYQQKQMDLTNQAVQAKISGNYLQAAMLGQQSISLGAEYARESQQLQMDKVIKLTQERKTAADKRGKLSPSDIKFRENLKSGNYGAISPLTKTPNTGLNYPTGGVVYNINANVSGVQDPQKAADLATTQVLRKLTLMDNKNNKSNKVVL